jgi:hypothetical protein
LRGENGRYILVIKAFWRSDKFLRIAVICKETGNLAIGQVYSVLSLVTKQLIKKILSHHPKNLGAPRYISGIKKS